VISQLAAPGKIGQDPNDEILEDVFTHKRRYFRFGELLDRLDFLTVPLGEVFSVND
jgi:hypothetical protein